jgi:hypothetical protein
VASERYLASAADLHAGRQPQAYKLSVEGLMVKDVRKAFLNWQEGKMEVGEIGE